MVLPNPKLVQALPLFSFLIIALLILTVHSQDTTTFNIDNFFTAANNLTFQGDVLFTTGPSGPSGFVRLTDARSSRVGRVLYSRPLQFWDSGRQSSFRTTIRFQITAVGNDPGDGIAFFIAPVGTVIPSGATGGNLGIFDRTGRSPALFAVEFDTHANREWDPNYRHIGININSRVSINTTRFDGLFGQVVTAEINYQARTRAIRVVVSSGSRVSTLNFVFDLSTLLTQRVQVGISASTGREASIHDLRSWHFTSTLQ